MALSNKHKKRIDRKFVSIEEELEYTKSEVRELNGTIKVIRLFFSLLGAGIILFDIIKDAISEKMVLRYEPGFNWQQWALLGFGFILLFVGIYKKPK